MEKNSGDENYSKGVKCLKTGLFQWSKDYAGAAFYFDEAVKGYKAEKNYDKAIIALTKNVEVNEKLHDDWACARNLEAIVTILLENVNKIDMNQIMNTTKNAGIHFRCADSAQNSVQLNHKVAKFFAKDKLYDPAIVLLKEALDDIEEHNLPHLKGEVLSTLISIFVEVEEYDEAMKVFKQEIDKNKENVKYPPFTQILSVMALYLIKKETIAAEEFLTKCFSEVTGFIKSRERETCEKLLDSYNEGDQEVFSELCIKPALSSIFPLNIVKQLKKVKVKQAGIKVNPDIIGDSEQVKLDDEAFKKSLL